MAYIIGIVAVIALLVVRTIPRNAHLVDGDTIDVRGRRWRLSGFDAPEHGQPGGREATAHLRRILATSRRIGIIRGRDVYGRTLVSIITSRGPLSWRMIASGNAHPLSAFGWAPLIWARLRGNGIWDGSHDVVPPRIWRAAHPRF